MVITVTITALAKALDDEQINENGSSSATQVPATDVSTTTTASSKACPKLSEIKELKGDSADPVYGNILNCHYNRAGDCSFLCRCCHKIFSEKRYSSVDITRDACVQHVRWCENKRC